MWVHRPGGRGNPTDAPLKRALERTLKGTATGTATGTGTGAEKGRGNRCALPRGECVVLSSGRARGGGEGPCRCGYWGPSTWRRPAGPALSGLKRKALLAALALNVGELLTVERLTEAVWGDEPPATALNTLQHHVRHLRSVLGGPDTIRWQTSGYVLTPAPDVTDVLMARRLVDEARAAPPASAADLLAAATGLWRGEPLSDLADLDWFAREAERLTEFRLATTEALLEARLARGEDAALVGELEALVRAHPFRERLRAAHMLALYRAGRQNEALASYRQVRELLDEELGVDPGPALRALETAILRQDPGLDPPPRIQQQAARVPVAAVPRRRVPRRIRCPRRWPSRSPVSSAGKPTSSACWRRSTPRPSSRCWAREARARPDSRWRQWPGRVDRFPDGVVVAELAGVASGEVVRHLAERAGVLDEDDDELLAALRAVLCDRSVLLVLDNCEHVLDAVAPLAEALARACPGLRVLATSRQPLGTYGEVRVPLEPLPSPRPSRRTRARQSWPSSASAPRWRCSCSGPRPPRRDSS